MIFLLSYNRLSHKSNQNISSYSKQQAELFKSLLNVLNIILFYALWIHIKYLWIVFEFCDIIKKMSIKLCNGGML